MKIAYERNHIHELLFSAMIKASFISLTTVHVYDSFLLFAVMIKANLICITANRNYFII